MKLFTQTVVLTAALCAVVGQTATYAQFKGKGGSSRGRSSQKFTGGSSRGNSGISRGSSGFRPSTSRTTTLNRPSSGGRPSGLSSSKIPQRPGSFKGPTLGRPSTTRPTLNTRPKPGIGKPTLPGKIPSLRPTKPSFPGLGKPPTTTNRPGRIPGLSKGPGVKPNLLPTTRPTDNGRLPAFNAGRPNFGNGSRPQQSKPNFSSTKVPTLAKPTQPHRCAGWKKIVHGLIHKDRRHWCHYRPNSCHWWVTYCKPIAHCHVEEIVPCNWARVTCAPIVSGQPTVHEVQWYLGMKGMLLPGKGIGIESVEPGSPADQVGLQPGMVMTVANGIALVDENAMNEAVRISGGILEMTLLSADGSQVLEGVVRMAQVSTVSF